MDKFPSFSDTQCGYIAIVGRPNVGKSTLMNRLLGQKISITCRKPQTTRHQILGIKTEENTQMIFVDTPGIHHKFQDKAINRYMNRAALNAFHFGDAILWLIEPQWTEQEEAILEHIQKAEVPVVLAINKIDGLKDRKALLPLLEEISKKYKFHSIIPISAKHGHQLEQLESTLKSFLPKAPFYFDKEQITDRSERFLVAEVIREKLMRFLGQELPYQLTVEVNWFKRADDGLIDLAATIYVERETQKRMIIGKQGAKLKQIGTEARQDLIKLLDNRVFLKLWVKVKSGWSDDDRALKSLGYLE